MTTLDCSDDRLVERARAGDHEAFRQLVRRYEPVVASTVIGMLGQGADADDVGQETMIRLYRSLDRFAGRSSLKTYLTRIAINASLDALRRRRRFLKRFWSLGGDEPQPEPQDSVDVSSRREVHRALRQLTPDHRAVVVLRLMQGYSTQETADLLNLPVGTVLSRLDRAKKRLVTLLMVDDDV